MPVYSFPTPYGIIRVRQGKDGSVSYAQDGSFHSQADCEGTSVCVYIHAMCEILRQARARNVLIIGCGGGTLATMLRRMHCRVTIVDINAEAFTIARRFFALPSEVRCVHGDGILFLRRCARKFDAIVVDVFGARNTVPPAFLNTRFFGLLSEALVVGGLMIMNFITANDGDRRAVKAAREALSAFADVALFDQPGEKDRNTLIVGGRLPHIRMPSGRQPEGMSDELRGFVRRAVVKIWHAA